MSENGNPSFGFVLDTSWIDGSFQGKKIKAKWIYQVLVNKKKQKKFLLVNNFF